MIDYRVDRTARIARGVIPGAFVVIDKGATIGEGVQIGPGVYIGPFVIVGTHADIGPHAVVLANVPAGAVVPPNIVWDETSAQGAEDVMDGPVKVAYKSVSRGRPRKVVRP